MKTLPTFDPAEILRGHVPSVDFHLHTMFTDGHDTVEACVQSALEKGLDSIAFSEHVSCNQPWIDGWFASFMDAISQCQKAHSDLMVYSGVEAKTTDFSGSLNVLEAQIQATDFVMGVVHGYPKDEKTGIAPNAAKISQDEARDIETKASLGILENPVVSVLGHLGGVYGKRFGHLPIEDCDRVIEKAAHRGIAVEINSKYHQKIALDLLHLCAKHGTRVTLGSDAHRACEIGKIVELLKGQNSE